MQRFATFDTVRVGLTQLTILKFACLQSRHLLADLAEQIVGLLPMHLHGHANLDASSPCCLLQLDCSTNSP